mmetsp:Transcript_939/g.2331  ORF Transcript_939/g.2331 Transcript_939/m.2331 type:complete len:261 (-) Transcript_939:833-1615(-)
MKKTHKTRMRMKSNPALSSMSLRIHKSGKNNTVMRAANVTSWKYRLRLTLRQTSWNLFQCARTTFEIQEGSASPSDEDCIANPKRCRPLRAAEGEKEMRREELTLSRLFTLESHRDGVANPSVVSTSSPSPSGSSLSRPSVFEASAASFGSVGLIWLDLPKQRFFRSRSPMKSRSSVVISSSPRLKATSSTVLPSASSSTGLACALNNSSMILAGAWSTAAWRNIGVAPLAMRDDTAERFVCRIASSNGAVSPPTSKLAP